MAGETVITLIGNLTADPELRFTPSGDGVANFTVASTPRTFDRQANEWKDGETLFMRCAAWRELSENVAETLLKGMRVVVTGRMKSRQYETKEGEKRTVIELEVDEIGPSLRYAIAKVERTQRGNGQQGGQGGGGFGGGQQGGNWQGGQQAQGGGFGGQQGGNWGGQQGQQGGGTWGGQQGGQQTAAHYQQAGANGAQGGGFGGQSPAADDPWATPGQPAAQGQPAGNWNQSAAQQAVTAQAQGQYQPQGGQRDPNAEPPF